MTELNLKEFKKFIAYARKTGAKRVRMGELEVEFIEIVPQAAQSAPSTAPTQADKQTRPTPAPAPTLEDINKWIYDEKPDEAH